VNTDPFSQKDYNLECFLGTFLELLTRNCPGQV